MDQSATQHESSTPLIMNGTKVAQDIRETLKTEVMALSERPGLAVILVGDNPASKAYVGMKKKACLEIGMDSFDYVLAASEGEKALIELIKFLNADEKVHGILLQLPLP